MQTERARREGFTKNFKTTGQDQFQPNLKHLWVKGTQVCSNEGPHPFTRGDNKEIAKIH